jgi:hypothetical protein
VAKVESRYACSAFTLALAFVLVPRLFAGIPEPATSLFDDDSTFSCRDDPDLVLGHSVDHSKHPDPTYTVSVVLTPLRGGASTPLERTGSRRPQRRGALPIRPPRAPP